jgi:hypothetical protein
MSEEGTFCRNTYCTEGCEEFVPGPKIGRDQWQSCATCTHSEQIHKELNYKGVTKR